MKGHNKYYRHTSSIAAGESHVHFYEMVAG